jgi:hypothetical protein
MIGKWTAAVLVCVMAGGCDVGEGGLPLPRQHDGESYPGDRQALRGVMEVTDWGCKNLATDGGSYLVIWPANSEEVAVDDLWAVRLPNGDVVGDGDPVVGTGAFTPTAPLEANRDTPLAHWVGNCAADLSEVIVLDSAERGE